MLEYGPSRKMWGPRVCIRKKKRKKRVWHRIAPPSLTSAWAHILVVATNQKPSKSTAVVRGLSQTTVPIVTPPPPPPHCYQTTAFLFLCCRAQPIPSQNSELKPLLGALGVRLADAELNVAAASLDADGSGDVSFSEFYAWCYGTDGAGDGER